MARRGTPLPWKLREEIKRLRTDGWTVRAIASYLNVSKRTVDKYR